MHDLLIAGVMALSLALRWQWQSVGQTWNRRWSHALAAFCLPPLLLLSTSGAVLLMGHHGRMMGLPVSPMGCWVGLTILGLVWGIFLFSLMRVFWFRASLLQYSWATLPSGEKARCLDSDSPLVVQVGFWRSQVLVSRGWLKALTETEQTAILCHEQAHAHYQDPFWFFWLGMMRRFTLWLPRTEELWQELLLLREIRADQWAVQEVDPLLLAELLVKLTRSIYVDTERPKPGLIGFCHGESAERLEQRIEALINPDYFAAEKSNRHEFAWLMLALAPFMATWLHH